MTGPRSLRERLALGALLITAACLAVLTLGFNVVLQRQLRQGADDLLASRAAAAAAAVQVDAAGAVTLRSAPEDAAVESTTWVYAGGTALERGDGDAAQQRRADSLAGVGVRHLETEEPDGVRLLARPVLSAGRQVGTVVSSVGLDPYDRVEDLALAASVGLAGTVLAGAYLLTRTLVGRALTPVAVMTEQAAQWSASDLGRRFGTGRRPLELEALAGTLDGVLDRLAAVLRHEQQLSAELSHELRTPLAAIIAEVELLDSRPRSPQEVTAGHAAVLGAAERMRNVLESLLAAARVTPDSPPGRSDVAAAVRAALATLDPPTGVVTVHERSPQLEAGVDRALLERALAPVLDNALRHRRRDVCVEVGCGPEGPWVSVSDDGPGVPAHLRETAFEPGVRGTQEHEGAGLGLALARRLARAGGGDLRLDPTATGARFVLALPTA